MKTNRLGFSLPLILAACICSAQVHTLNTSPNSPIFLPPAIYVSGGYFTSSVAATDLNGGGNLDLIAIGNCGPVGVGGCVGSPSVGVRLGRGDGTF